MSAELVREERDRRGGVVVGVGASIGVSVSVGVGVGIGVGIGIGARVARRSPPTQQQPAREFVA